jgi:hypothetical protein
MYRKITRRNISSQMTPGKLPDVSSMVSTPSNTEEFYQFEPAVVLDSILDESHPEIQSSEISEVSTPPKFDGTGHGGELDLSLLGHIRARLLYSEKGASALSTKWIGPLNPTFTEVPLINEIVHVVEIRGQLYYTQRVAFEGRLNYSGDFDAELKASDSIGRPIKSDSDLDDLEEYDGPKINITFGDKDLLKNFGVGGEYFSFNDKIRRLRRFEGDLIVESRFGQSIRFGAYDENDQDRKGFDKYEDYKKTSETSVVDGSEIDTGKGNPFILIRNRQKADPVENNHFYSTVQENINEDGSSIQLTSGLTKSKLKFFTNQDGSHFKKSIFSATVSEEQAGFSPKGATSWSIPELTGDQTSIFSDRILIGSRSNEILMFSKSRLGLKSDSEVTVDSHQQIVLTTNEKTVINSPFIYLGEYDQTREPAVLGETLIEWLYDLGEWLKTHTHYYHHSHPDAGGAKKPESQTPVQIAALENLIQKLPMTLSKRVFVTGGGYAEGLDGSTISELNNSRVGKVSEIPGGYFVAPPGSFNGEING